jgi:hypothetical protein
MVDKCSRIWEEVDMAVQVEIHRTWVAILSSSSRDLLLEWDNKCRILRGTLRAIPWQINRKWDRELGDNLRTILQWVLATCLEIRDSLILFNNSKSRIPNRWLRELSDR